MGSATPMRGPAPWKAGNGVCWARARVGRRKVRRVSLMVYFKYMTVARRSLTSFRADVVADQVRSAFDVEFAVVDEGRGPDLVSFDRVLQFADLFVSLRVGLDEGELAALGEADQLVAVHADNGAAHVEHGAVGGPGAPLDLPV